MKTKIPVYEAKISLADDTGIFAMSFVDVPANENNFVALARSAATPVKLSLDKQKQILTGVVLVPDQMIYRNDTQLGAYYLKFKAADIEQIRDKMMQKGVALNTTTHQHESMLKGNHLVECWIVEDPKNDKANALGLGELKKGTLVASYKVNSPEYWRTQVLAGKVKGFSIEGFFNFKNVTMAKTAIKPDAAKKAARGNTMATLLKSMAAYLEGDTTAETKDLVDVAKVDETDSGAPYIIFTLSDGTEIDVDSDGFCTVDDAQAPAGEHALVDGNTIVIGDDGILVETTPEAEAVEPAAAEAALAAAREEAKARGVKAAKMFAKPATKLSAKDKEISSLKAKLAKLEAEPSAPKAKPVIAEEGRTEAKLKGWQRAAQMVRERNERHGG